MARASRWTSGFGKLPLGVNAAEQRRCGLASDAGRRQVSVKKFLGFMMSWDGVFFSAFLMQPYPPAFALLVIILDVHAKDGADAGETVDHDPDQGAVAEGRQRPRGFRLFRELNFLRLHRDEK